MQTDAFLRSTSARLSLGYAALLVTAFVLVGLLFWFTARNTAETELREEIELEVTAIETELRTEGLDAAIAAIEARAEHPGAFEYWVLDEHGKPLVGDFPEMAGPTGWRHMTIGADAVGAEHREEMIVLNVELPGGIRLGVGDDLGRAREVQNSLLAALGSIGGAAVLICLVLGVVVTRKVLSRVNLLDATLAKVAAGDIEARFPARPGTTDDVERIGAAVNAMLGRIEDLVANVRRVSRDVAHDLRTPLSHLQQRLEQAANEPCESARAEAIEAAQAKIAEILRIFDALLRLAEIEAGAARRRFKPLDLGALAEKVADAYRPDVEESGQQLVVDTARSCTVLGDSDLLAQALANLIENAMRHSPAGTRIRLRVDAANERVRLETVDDGPGIPAEARGRVLEPFMRLDQSRTTPGSGLGLSMVAAIARVHDAALTLEDASPGLRVSLSFPRARASR